MAKEIVTALIDNGDIEVEEQDRIEAQKDFEGIINEYVRAEKEIVEETKSVMAARGLSGSKFSETKRAVAASRKFPLDDDGLDFILNQILEFMLISNNIAEVYAEDHVMRKRMVDIVRKYLKLDDQIDQEVRKRLKHLQEGTRDWEIAYRKTQEEVRRAKGL
jgi:hypothetical protein